MRRGTDFYGEESDSWLVHLWNFYAAVISPAVVWLMVLFKSEIQLEAGMRVSMLTFGALGIFIPLVIFHLKYEFHPAISVVGTLSFLAIFVRLAVYFFIQRYQAPLTFWGVVVVLVSGAVWSIVIECNHTLTWHLQDFPQNEWLFPCSHNVYNQRFYKGMWLVLLVPGVIFLFLF
ncbi:hypothetical protein [Granulicatella balaenopterae]|nr:hypothetical protein [Granulicatella balaenopterae]